MHIKQDDILQSILESLSQIGHIHAEDIPNIELYMDQVTTFMETSLQSTKRYPDDKILTKTMINNYAKNNLLPPPVKKKYSKEHVLVLIFIYYFKNILSIKDIETLLKPLTDSYFQTDTDFNLTSIYQEICDSGHARVSDLAEDITALWQFSESSFSDAPEASKDFLKKFAFICNLSFDVYIKKQIIEHLIDTLPSPDKKKSEKGKSTKKA